MKIICKPRRGGKTYEAIKLAHKNNSYMVCFSKQECSRVFHLAKDLGYDIHFPICLEELRSNRLGPGVESVVIDNADYILERLINREVKGFTITDWEAYNGNFVPNNDEIGKESVLSDELLEEAAKRLLEE